MVGIASASRLSFFKVSKYEYVRRHVCDFGNCPRPHFCMGLIIEGEGVFSSESGDVHVGKGDIIFVPITSKYISTWCGDPDIIYISMHFSFEPGGIFSSQTVFDIQRIALPQFDSLKADFKYALENYDGGDKEKLKTLGIFYKVMGEVVPRLEHRQTRAIDKRIEQAVEYIDLNYANDFSASELAMICRMSESHFYACFKNEVGMSPVQYKLKVRINHAILMLIDNTGRSIEEISGMLGFESSVYFRRVFKRLTGKSPREYKKSSIEL